MSRGVILDTNVAMLFFVGLTGRRNINRHGRVKRFTVHQFEALANAIELGREFVIAAPILAEVSNLLRQGPDDIWIEAVGQMRSIVPRSREIRPSCVDVVTMRSFEWLGYADAALLSALNEDVALITCDGPLFRAALTSGKYATHLEELA